ncbi:Protein NRT1/ PTR FAMILY 5.14 [Bienertia sinuspersici]
MLGVDLGLCSPVVGAIIADSFLGRYRIIIVAFFIYILLATEEMKAAIEDGRRIASQWETVIDIRDQDEEEEEEH